MLFHMVSFKTADIQLHLYGFLPAQVQQENGDLSLFLVKGSPCLDIRYIFIRAALIEFVEIEAFGPEDGRFDGRQQGNTVGILQVMFKGIVSDGFPYMLPIDRKGS